MKPMNVNMLVFISRCGEEAQAGFQSIRAAPAEGGKAPCTRRVEVGSGATNGSDPTNGCGLGAAPVRRRPTIAQAKDIGTPAATGRRAGARTGQTADGRRAGSRVPHGALDAAAHRQAHYRTL